MSVRHYRRDDLENQLNRGALWAVTYGDLMSYLMVLFLILFSFSIGKTSGGEKRKYEESMASIQRVFGGKADPDRLSRAQSREREDNAARNLSEALESRQLSKYAEVQATEEKVILTLKEPVLFDLGSASLKPQALPVLEDIAQELSKLPNPVVIEGHTDNLPIKRGRYTSNWELSMARAYAVIRLLESKGVASSRLSGIGYGEHKPAADNASADGRARNRRIGINLIRG